MTTISMDKQYTTRDGRPVRLLCVDGPKPASPVVGVIEGYPDIDCWRLDGKFSENGVAHEDDLIEAKPCVQCEVWVHRASCGKYYFARSGKEKLHECKIVARVTIDVAEGHGLEGGG